jgi:hypothetical protein
MKRENQFFLIVFLLFTVGCATLTYPRYKVRKEGSKLLLGKSYVADSIFFNTIYLCDFESSIWNKTEEQLLLSFGIDSLFDSTLRQLSLKVYSPRLNQIIFDSLCFEGTLSKKELLNLRLSSKREWEIIPIVKLTKNTSISMSGGGGIEIPDETDNRKILLTYRIYLLVYQNDKIVYFNNAFSYEGIEIHKDETVAFSHNPETIKAMINEAMGPFIERLE